MQPSPTRRGRACLAFAVSLLAALAAPLAAQRTFVVDASNGPGTHFVDLGAALAQAQHRDVFLIRDGTYGAVTTNRGVALVGVGPAVVIAAPWLTPTSALVVSDVPAGETFTAKGIELTSLFGSPTAAVRRCDGRVHLARLRVRHPTRTALAVETCAVVTVAGSTMDGVSITGSTVAFGTSTSVGVRPMTGTGGNPGLRCTDSRVWITDSVLRGTDGYSSGSTQFVPQPALVASASEIWLAGTGTRTCTLTSGVCLSSTCFPQTAPACTVEGGLLRHTSNVDFVTVAGTPPIAGSGQVVVDALPALVTSSATRGTPFSIRLASTPGDPFVVAIAAPADPVAVSEGAVFVDPSALVVVASTAQGPSGVTTFGVPVPADPTLVGRAVVVQAASFAIPTGRLRLSNPAGVVVD